MTAPGQDPRLQFAAPAPGWRTRLPAWAWRLACWQIRRHDWTHPPGPARTCPCDYGAEPCTGTPAPGATYCPACIRICTPLAAGVNPFDPPPTP